MYKKETKTACESAQDNYEAGSSGDQGTAPCGENGTDASVLIGFFHENEAYGCFSNWYPAAFKYAGKHFDSCCYQNQP